MTMLQFANTQQWYVIHCKSQREPQAAAALHELLGLSVYLPLLNQNVRQVPLFPGYLFVQANLYKVAPSHINAVPNIVRLVTFNDVPQSLPDDTIPTLQQRLAILNANGGKPRFQPGDRVRITQGPFQHLEAIFQGPLKPNQRVQVLIEFLGSLRTLEVSASHVERLDMPPQPKRERRTRGRGRPIRSPLTH
jgi:transcriptional antiterminator RfaH